MGTDKAAIAKLAAESPPDWVASEFPSEQPQHKVTLTKGFWIDRNEVSNTDFAAFRAAGGYTNQALWSDDGWTWLGGRDAARLPLHCNGDVPGPAPDLHHLVRGRGVRRMAGRPSPDGGGVGVRRARAEVDRLPVGRHVRPRARQRPQQRLPEAGRQLSDRCQLGRCAGHVRATPWSGSPTGSTLAYYTKSPATDPTGPATGEVKVEKGGWWGSNEFVARSAYRHYEDPPTYGDKHIGFRVVSQ